MKLLPINCNQCRKIIYRSKSRINEAKKFGWKTYCSIECSSRARYKQKELICSNPVCNRIFKRQPNDLKKSINFYCSQSCSAIVNNSRFPKKQAVIKNCHYCKKQFKGREKYCSKVCKNASQIIDKGIIVALIKAFRRKTGRIPLKREFSQHKAARLRFDTWNNAIIAAGLSPNPVKFAKKHAANDGHKCDSLAEKIIDDWLHARSIPHQRSVPYHKNHMTADFSVNGTLIEFFGLQGQLKGYDKLIAKKKKLWKEKDLKVIEIYPKHLFPRNRLDEILKF